MRTIIVEIIANTPAATAAEARRIRDVFRNAVRRRGDFELIVRDESRSPNSAIESLAVELGADYRFTPQTSADVLPFARQRERR